MALMFSHEKWLENGCFSRFFSPSRAGLFWYCADWQEGPPSRWKAGAVKSSIQNCSCCLVGKKMAETCWFNLNFLTSTPDVGSFVYLNHMSSIWCYIYVLAFCCLWSSCHGQFSQFISDMNNALLRNHHYLFLSATLIQTGSHLFKNIIYSHILVIEVSRIHIKPWDVYCLLVLSSSCFMTISWSAQQCVDHMLQPTFSFNTEVLHQSTHDTHRVSHSPLSRKPPGRFHFSSYKIMDGHHTSLGASTAHHGPHKDVIYSCWINPLSLLFSPSFLFSATARTLIVDDGAAYRRPLCYSPLSVFAQDWSGCVASTLLSPSSEPNHPEHHILPLIPHHLSPLYWCLVCLPHFNLIKVDFWYREWEGF